MKTAVVYNSQTGFTEKYAKWIAEASSADCFGLSEAKKKDLSSYDAIVFGSGLCAGGLSKVDWLKKNAPQWQDKKLIAFCVGGSPADSPDIPTGMARIFEPPELQGVQTFYCPGGFNYERMSLGSKLAMKAFVGVLRAKKGKTPAEQQMVEVISSSYDLSDKKYIAGIVDLLKE